MKVLHITTADMGGAGLCCLRIHQSLLNLGVESKVVSMRNFQHFEEEYEYGYLKEKISKIPSKIFRLLGLVITERNKILRLSKQNEGIPYSRPLSSVNLLRCKWVEWADIIHLHWVCNYLDYPSFFQEVRKPIVWTLHDEFFFFGIAHFSINVLDNNPIEEKYARIKYESLKEVKKLGIVLLSEFFLNKFKENKLLSGREVRVINNPIDTDLFKPIPRAIARKKLGISNDTILFGFTAYSITEKRKGLDVLSNVLQTLNPNIKIIAIGGNSTNKTWPNVITVGSQNNANSISEILSALDYYAMPSYQEAFAQSPMEAMACGIPVVVFPVSGTSELVNDFNGVICDDFSPQALKEGIEKMMSRKYNPIEIREDMIRRFSPNVISKKYIDLYNTLLV